MNTPSVTATAWSALCGPPTVGRVVSTGNTASPTPTVGIRTPRNAASPRAKTGSTAGAVVDSAPAGTVATARSSTRSTSGTAFCASLRCCCSSAVRPSGAPWSTAAAKTSPALEPSISERSSRASASSPVGSVLASSASSSEADNAAARRFKRRPALSSWIRWPQRSNLAIEGKQSRSAFRASTTSSAMAFLLHPSCGLLLDEKFCADCFPPDPARNCPSFAPPEASPAPPGST